MRVTSGLLGFKNDMLVMTYSKDRQSILFIELDSLQQKWNLRLNNEKFDILTQKNEDIINGVNCTKTVRYIGVRIVLDKKEQLKIA